MRKFLLLIFALLIFSLAPHSLLASDDNVITWYQMNFSPARIIDKGPYRGKGFADLILADILKELPQYKHDKKMPI